MNIEELKRIVPSISTTRPEVLVIQFRVVPTETGNQDVTSIQLVAEKQYIPSMQLSADDVVSAFMEWLDGFPTYDKSDTITDQHFLQHRAGNDIARASRRGVGTLRYSTPDIDYIWYQNHQYDNPDREWKDPGERPISDCPFMIIQNGDKYGVFIHSETQNYCRKIIK